MSLNKMCNTTIGHDLNLQIGCDSLLANNVICDNLNAGVLVFPQSQLPEGQAILTLNNSTLKYAVAPYAMCNLSAPYQLLPNIITQISGGDIPAAIGSSSAITYANNFQYDFKIVGECFTSQPIMTFYLHWGSVILNRFTLTQVTPYPQSVVEINASILILGGFPSSTGLSTSMKVSFTPWYDNTLPIPPVVTPIAPVCVTNMRQTGGANIPVGSKLSISMMIPSGTGVFVNNISNMCCAYSPMLVLPA